MSILSDVSQIYISIICSLLVWMFLFLISTPTLWLIYSVLHKQLRFNRTLYHIVKAMVFPVVIYGCKSGTIKQAELQRIDAFELYVGEDSWESLGLQGDATSPS